MLLRSEYYLKTANLLSTIRPCYTYTHNKIGNVRTVQRNTRVPSNLWSWTLLRWSHHFIHCGHTFLGASAYSQKASVTFVLSVPLLVLPYVSEQLSLSEFPWGLNLNTACWNFNRQCYISNVFQLSWSLVEMILFHLPKWRSCILFTKYLLLLKMAIF